MGDVNMAALEETVAGIETVVDSAVALINGFADQIAAVRDDPAAIDAVLARGRAAAAKLGEAVQANTPAAPPVEPAPPEA